MLIRVSKKCNQNCLFCSFDEKNSQEDSYISRWLRDIGDEKLVQISGGEPLLSNPSALLSFCAKLVKMGRQIEFQTNGTLIEKLDEGYLKKLISIVKISDGYFNINFSASDPLLDFKITRLKGAFSSRIRGVKFLKKNGVEIRFTYVINSFNYKKLLNYSTLVCKLKPDLVQFSFVKGIGNAAGSKKIIPAYEKVSPFLIKAMTYLEKKGINFEVDHIPCCHLGRFWQRNVDVWKMKNKVDGPHLREKKKTILCKDCKLASFCSGPRKDYLAVRAFKKGKIFSGNHIL